MPILACVRLDVMHSAKSAGSWDLDFVRCEADDVEPNGMGKLAKNGATFNGMASYRGIFPTIEQAVTAVAELVDVQFSVWQRYQDNEYQPIPEGEQPFTTVLANPDSMYSHRLVARKNTWAGHVRFGALERA
ncbi:MAG: hypothetical protein JWM95_4455 [Gemmatimonadetes bacterium]|nr:hypothetical protein [Gemmatimonadota bacterium]